MKPKSFTNGSRTVHCRCILATACFLLLWMPVYPSENGQGCKDVEFVKQPLSRYSPESLRTRLQRNPADVDALLNLGVHLEEQEQISEAEALYEKAIETKPDCYLGYLFAGLVCERIGEKKAGEANADIHKALTLEPNLSNDGNVQGFLKRHMHPPLLNYVSPIEEDMHPDARRILGAGNRFLIGLGTGVLITSLIFYVTRRTQERTA